MILFAVKKPVSVLALATYLFSFAGTASADPGMVVPRELSDEQVLSVVQAEPQPKTSPEDASGKLESIHSLFLDPSAISRSTPADDESHAYEPERYAFEDAVELLRPEYSSAVILEDLSPRDMERLQKLDFEVGIIVLHGEIVLFTTGDEQEIGMLQATQKLLDQADFISHTHVAGYTQDGPSTYDLNHAVAAPQMEYVVTQNGAYAYNSGGLANDGQPYDLNDYLVRLYRAKHASEVKDQVKARAALNEFIYLTDLYNETEEEERELFRAGSTPLLDSITATINGGATHTNNPSITLNFTVGLEIPEGEQLQVAFSQDGINYSVFENLPSSKTLNLSGADGTKALFLKIVDKAGNSRSIQRDIVLDRQIPVRNLEYVLKEFEFEKDQAESRKNFGGSIAYVGDLIAVGDPYRNAGFPPLGIVELFTKDGRNAGVLNHPGPSDLNRFGHNLLSIEDKYLAVSAGTFTPGIGGEYKRAVILYDMDPASATYLQPLISLPSPQGPLGNDNYGGSLGYMNGLLFVGAPSEDFGSTADRGNVYVFDINPDSATFGHHLKTIGALKYREFGSALTPYKESTMVVGSKDHVVYVNADRNSPAFGQVQYELNFSGRSMALAEDYLILGNEESRDDDRSKPEMGRVVVVNGDPSSPDFGEIIKTIKSPQPRSFGHFGAFITVHDKKIYIGGPGSDSSNVQGEIFILNGDVEASDFGEVNQYILGEALFGSRILIVEDSMYVTIPAPYTTHPGEILKFELGEKGSAFSLNDGNPFTNSRALTVDLDILDNETEQENLRVSFSQDGANFTAYEPYGKTKALTLNEGSDGTRSIWMRVKDEAGNVATFSKTIILDRQPPLPASAGPVLSINNGAGYTNNRQPAFNIHPDIRDNFTDPSEILMGFSEDGINFPESSFIAYDDVFQADAVFFANFSSNGNQTRYIKFRDAAGNESAIYSDSIIYDVVAPVGTINVNNSAVSTTNQTVNLTLTASDAISGLDKVRFGLSVNGIVPNVVWADWQDFSGNSTFNLLPASGTHTVYMEIRDKAGNVRTVSDSIILDVPPSQTGPLTINGTGRYELNLGQEFKDLMARLIPSSLASRFSSGTLLSVEFTALFSYLQEKMADVFDFVVAFPTITAIRQHLKHFAAVGLGSILGLGAPADEDIGGIGLGEDDPGIKEVLDAFTPVFEANFSAFLQAVLAAGAQKQGTAMLDIESILNDLNSDDYVDRVLLEELAHRWLVHLGSGLSSDNDPLNILGRDNAHWSAFFNAGTSPLDGIKWRDNGNGTFTMVSFFGIDMQVFADYALGKRSTLPMDAEFNDFDLYAMGLLDEDSVAPSFVIENPRTLSGSPLTEDNYLNLLFSDINFFTGGNKFTIRGQPRTVTVQDIIAIEGPRDPLSAEAQKDFTAALVLIKDVNQSSSASEVTRVRTQVNRLANELSSLWSSATRGLSTMTLGPAAGAFNLFKERVLDTFDAQAGGGGEGDPAEVSKGKDNLSVLDQADALILEVETALAPLAARSAAEPLVARFIAGVADQISAFKTQLTQLRSGLQTALDNAEDGDDFFKQKRDELADLVSQAGVTGLLPEGFGAAAEELIDQVKNIFSDLELVNDDFALKGPGLKDDLEALLARLKGPVRGKSFTPFGEARMDSADPKFGDTSFSFDGRGDYVSSPDHADFDFGNGNFTIDGWVKFDAESHGAVTVASKYTGGAGWIFQVDPWDNKMVLFDSGSSARKVNTSVDLKANEWYHVAVVRDGNNLKFFLNGVQQGSNQTAAQNYNGAKTSLSIGMYDNSSFMKGRMDELRISKGVARWSTNFTPESDEYDRDTDTSFLLHFSQEEFDALAEVDPAPKTPDTEAPSGSVSINSGAAKTTSRTVTLTLSGTDNRTSNAKLQMAVSVDGGSTFTSYEAFSATKSVTLPDGDGTKTVVVRYKDEAGNAADFQDTITYEAPIPDNENPAGSVSINSGAATTASRDVTLTLTGSDNITNNANLQMAVSVDGGSTFTSYESFKTSKTVSLTGENGTKTVVVRYKDEAGNTADFQDTISLDIPVPAYDAKPLSIRGDTSVNSADPKFGDTSFSFDGRGDYVSSPDHADFDFGNGNFTIDGWVKFDAESHGAVTVASKYTGGAGWIFQVDPWDNKMVLFDSGSSARKVNTSVDLKANEWYHVAVVRDGNNLKFFLNGVQQGSNQTAAQNYNGAKTSLSIGMYENSSFMKGRMDELRISKGVARWSTNFTPESDEYDRDTDTSFLLHFSQEEFDALAEVDPAPKTPDMEAPSGSVSINSGAAKTTSRTVTLTLSGTDNRTSNAKLQMAVSVDGGSTFTSYEAFSATKSVTLPDGDGTKTVVVRYKDEAGNTADFQDTITYEAPIPDHENPAGSVSINSGAATTASRDVTLTLTGSDNITNNANLQMAVSVDGGSTFTSYESFKTSKTVSLTGENGTKTVVVRYKDEAGNTADFQDTISLDIPVPAYDAKPLSIRGDTSVNSSDPKFGDTSFSFDGRGDYVSSPDHADFDFGNGNFTIDGWVKFDAESHGAVTVASKYTGGAGWIFQVDPWDNKMVLFDSGSSARKVNTSVDLKANEWYHVAVVREGNALKFFLNGVQQGSNQSAAQNYNGAKTSLSIGMYENSSFMKGRMDEIRISKGVARWSTNFTPESDEYDRDTDTSFLLHFSQEEFDALAEVDPAPKTPDTEAPSGSVSVNSGAAKTTSRTVTLTLSGTDNRTSNAKLQMAVSVDGGSTFTSYETFSASKSVTLPDGDGTKTVVVRYKDEAGNTADFQDTITYEAPIPDHENPAGSVSINSGAATTASRDVTLTLTGSDNITNNANLQMAVSVDGGSTFTSYEIFKTSKTVSLTGENGTKTVVVRYKDEAGNTADFQDTISLDIPVPPYDAKTLSIRGDTSVNSSDPKFGDTAFSFDGRGDYVSSPDHADFDFGNGNFTIDGWVKFDAESHGAVTVASKYTGGAGWIFQVDPWDNKMVLFDSGSSARKVNTSVDLKANEWYHVAVVREGNALKFFLNGVQQGSNQSAAQNYNGAKTSLSIGMYENSSFMKGRMDEIRISKGVARWSTNFTPESDEYDRDTDTSFLLHFSQEEFDALAEVDPAPKTPDTEAPSGSVSINSGAAKTTSRTVTLTLSGTDNRTSNAKLQMAVSVDGGSTFTSYEAFSASKSVTLPDGDGTKTVVVRYKDEAGNTADFQDTITYEAPIPDHENPAGSVSINSGAATTASRDVTLTLTGTDNITSSGNLQMAVSVDGGSTFTSYESFKTSKTVSLTGENGTKTVVVRYKDEAGNTADFQDTISLDIPVPPYDAKTLSIRGDTSVNSSDPKFGDTSFSFDGRGDYVSSPDHADFDFGNGNFTIDGWVKFDAESHGAVTVASKYTGGAGWIFQVDPWDNKMVLFDSGSSARKVNTSVDLKANEWYHVAVVREGNALKFFLNGVHQGSNQSAAQNYNGAKTALNIGAYDNSSFMKGRMDELRISKGVARWSTNFTPESDEYDRDTDTSFLLHFSQAEFSASSEV